MYMQAQESVFLEKLLTVWIIPKTVQIKEHTALQFYYSTLGQYYLQFMNAIIIIIIIIVALQFFCYRVRQ